MTIFIRTSRFAEDSRYSNALSLDFPSATDSSFDLIRAAMVMLPRIWRDGLKYAKAGVYLSELSEKDATPRDLLTYQVAQTATPLMRAMDRLNSVFGHDTVKPARILRKKEDIHGNWLSRREMRSPSYTTRWQDMLRVS